MKRISRESFPYVAADAPRSAVVPAGRAMAAAPDATSPVSRGSCALRHTAAVTSVVQIADMTDPDDLELIRQICCLLPHFSIAFHVSKVKEGMNGVERAPLLRRPVGQPHQTWYTQRTLPAQAARSRMRRGLKPNAGHRSGASEGDCRRCGSALAGGHGRRPGGSAGVRAGVGAAGDRGRRLYRPRGGGREAQHTFRLHEHEWTPDRLAA